MGAGLVDPLSTPPNLAVSVLHLLWSLGALCFDALRVALIACRFCGASLDLPALPAAADAVVRLERALLRCARGGTVANHWVGPCDARTFLRLVADLLNLMGSRVANQSTVIAEHLPDVSREYPRLRTRCARDWTERSLGERVSLLRGVVSLLRIPQGTPSDALFQLVVELLPQEGVERFCRLARHWPRRIRRRLQAGASGASQTSRHSTISRRASTI